MYANKRSIEDATLYEVYNFGLKQQLKTKEEKRLKDIDTYIVSYKNNIFLGVITYPKNLVGHYNDHNPPMYHNFFCDLRIFMGFV